MANFRTRTAQQAYARRESKPADYFASGEENEATQQRQHEFLLKYANTGREGSIAPIIDVLKAERQRQQIGRASCRERVCQYVKIAVVAVSLKKKKKRIK